MTEIINKILENSKKAYKKSILINNEELEELLFSIITDTKRVLDEVNSEEKNINNVSSQNRTEEEEIKRVRKKIPSWFSKPNQYNHKILVAYMKLSNKNKDTITMEVLEKEAGLKNSQVFISNFNQMKIISYKNHGKVFIEENGIIKLWEPVADFIVNEYEKIIDIERRTKEKIYDFLKRAEYSNELNFDTKGGNLRYSKKNSAKDVFWINVAVDNRVNNDMFFILNNIEDKKVIYLKIPANTINKENFKIKNSDGNHSYDIELSSKKETFLIDVKSGGTKFDFKPFIIEEISIGDLND